MINILMIIAIAIALVVNICIVSINVSPDDTACRPLATDGIGTPDPSPRNLVCWRL